MSELTKITWKDIKVKDDGVYIHVVHCKTNKAGVGQDVFILHLSDPRIDPNFIILIYDSLIPRKIDQFFMRYQGKKFTQQPIGKNTLAKVPSKIATHLGLPNPNQYTGHSLHVTSATILADAGVSTLNLKKHAGWKSDAIAEGYLRESKNNKVEIANVISEDSNQQVTNVQPVFNQTTPTTTQSITPSISNGVFNNCVFNIHQK